MRSQAVRATRRTDDAAKGNAARFRDHSDGGRRMSSAHVRRFLGIGNSHIARRLFVVLDVDGDSHVSVQHDRAPGCGGRSLLRLAIPPCRRIHRRKRVVFLARLRPLPGGWRECLYPGRPGGGSLPQFQRNADPPADDPRPDAVDPTDVPLRLHSRGPEHRLSQGCRQRPVLLRPGPHGGPPPEVPMPGSIPRPDFSRSAWTSFTGPPGGMCSPVSALVRTLASRTGIRCSTASPPSIRIAGQMSSSAGPIPWAGS